MKICIKVRNNRLNTTISTDLQLQYFDAISLFILNIQL